MMGELKTILNFDKKGKLKSNVYIEVGLMEDKHLLRRRLELNEDDLKIDLIGLDIKKILFELKKKQMELLEADQNQP